jgi:hypothetical protein
MNRDEAADKCAGMINPMEACRFGWDECAKHLCGLYSLLMGARMTSSDLPKSLEYEIDIALNKYRAVFPLKSENKSVNVTKNR